MSSKFAEDFVQLISANKADETKVLTHGYSRWKEENGSLRLCLYTSISEGRITSFSLREQKATKRCP